MSDRKSPPVTVVEGRDEMNLADFPISVLDTHQPTRIDGGKVDTVVYEATRYDPLTKRRMPQRVTLLTNSQIGLPTPTDENVVLGLLCLAKQASNFESPRVHFTPHALMRVLRWAPTGKNYQRLRDSLRRLKALTIRYENAWWDKDGRQYQSEFSTGLLSEYFLATQVRGRRKADAVPENFVVFSPRFYESLQKGNLKRLDLNTLFSLKLPTSQRMYRFLDKRFYHSQQFEMDLVEFACGHIGMTPTKNVAHLKQRLDPPIAELEEIGFLAKSQRHDRYTSLGPKIWRVALQKASRELPQSQAKPLIERTPEEHLVRVFYTTRFGTEPLIVTTRERELATEVIARYTMPKAVQLIESAAHILKTAWPEGKTFHAVMSYLPEGEQRLNREATRTQMMQKLSEQADQERQQRAEHTQQLASQRLKWEALSPDEKHTIRERVIAQQPKTIVNHPALVERFCLLELSRRATISEPSRTE